MIAHPEGAKLSRPMTVPVKGYGKQKGAYLGWAWASFCLVQNGPP